MDFKQFYSDLYEWVQQINQKSQQLNQDEYWNFILLSAGELSKKYKENDFVKLVINAHIDFLEEAWKESNKK